MNFSQLSYRDNSLDTAPGLGCSEFLAKGDNFDNLHNTDFRRKLCDAWHFDFVASDDLTWPSVEMCYLAYHYAMARNKNPFDVHKAFVCMTLPQARRLVKRHRMPRSKTQFWAIQGAAVRRHCLTRKFYQSTDLRQLLINTGNAQLIRGKSDCCGHGKSLMILRYLLQLKPKGWESVDHLEAAFHAAS